MIKKLFCVLHGDSSTCLDLPYAPVAEYLRLDSLSSSEIHFLTFSEFEKSKINALAHDKRLPVAPWPGRRHYKKKREGNVKITVGVESTLSLDKINFHIFSYSLPFIKIWILRFFFSKPVLNLWNYNMIYWLTLYIVDLMCHYTFSKMYSESIW